VSLIPKWNIKLTRSFLAVRMMMRRLGSTRRLFSTAEADEVQAVIANDIKTFPIMVYMKGTPEAPQCGFSKKTVQILQTAGVEFASRNVLVDEPLRSGIKVFSEWPTIPQVYIAGEFVGGSDTLFEMMKSGELDTLLNEKKISRIKD
jgi:monothiol glutaredoxin